MFGLAGCGFMPCLLVYLFCCVLGDVLCFDVCVFSLWVVRLMMHLDFMVFV